MRTRAKTKTIKRYCSVFRCSIKKRTSKAQTRLEGLKRHKPHPTMDGLFFVEYRPSGTEVWRTADEIADRAEYMLTLQSSKRSTATKRNATRRQNATIRYDRIAREMFARHQTLGMSKDVFRSLPKPVQHRLLRQLPSIVHNDEEDRLARLETHRAAQVVASENSATAYREQMELKMEAVRRRHAIQRSEVKPVGLVVPVVTEPIEPMTQADLVELSQRHPDSSKITTRLEALYNAYDDPDEYDTDEDDTDEYL